MNNAPFSIGQKVVALVKSKSELGHVAYNKGDQFTVMDILCHCGFWMIDIGLTVPAPFDNTQCPKCYSTLSWNKAWYSYAEHFAPIQTNYADATAEILEKFPVEDGGRTEKIKTPKTETA